MAPSIRLLIVDDEVSFAKSLAEHLTRCGYAVSVAFDGQQAFQRLEQEQPALALIDLKLPDLNGEEIVHHAKRVSPQTKIIVLTAYHDEGIREGTLRQAGVAGYLYKPLKSLLDLERQIKEAIG